MFCSTTAALACGGFFCDSPPSPTVVPIEQTEESVVFSVDPVADTTTMHVQIAYEGPVSEFAWILPVPGEPNLGRSSQRLFDVLEANTQERWQTTFRTDASCFDDIDFSEGDGDSDADADADSDADADADTDADADPPVVVVSSETVGPYETVVLTATDSAALMTWLTDNAFSIPAGVEPLLAPYVADGMHFVALKLGKDNDAGDLEPLALTVSGTQPSIPIQLTALAAAEDMPMSVYLLGDTRAYPDNYLHVQRNLFHATWPGQSGQVFLGNQPDALSRAVDAAGGQAFATLYAGQAPAGWTTPDVSSLRATSDVLDWLAGASDLGIRLTVSELSVILPLTEPSLVTPEDFYADPASHPLTLERLHFNADLQTDRLQEHVLEPIAEAGAMVENATFLTRLATTLSPAEMTVDPTFAFHPHDRSEASPAHQLDLARDCGRRQLDRTPFEVTVDDMTLRGPTQRSLNNQGIDIFTWMREAVPHDLLYLEAYQDGELVALEDHRPEQAAQISCGCRTTGPAAVFSVLPLLLMGLRRR